MDATLKKIHTQYVDNTQKVDMSFAIGAETVDIRLSQQDFNKIYKLAQIMRNRAVDETRMVKLVSQNNPRNKKGTMIGIELPFVNRIEEAGFIDFHTTTLYAHVNDMCSFRDRLNNIIENINKDKYQ